MLPLASSRSAAGPARASAAARPRAIQHRWRRALPARVRQQGESRTGGGHGWMEEQLPSGNAAALARPEGQGGDGRRRRGRSEGRGGERGEGRAGEGRMKLIP